MLAIVMIGAMVAALPGTLNAARDRGVNQPGAAGNIDRDPGINQPGPAGNVGRDPGINQPGRGRAMWGAIPGSNQAPVRRATSGAIPGSTSPVRREIGDLPAINQVAEEAISK